MLFGSRGVGCGFAEKGGCGVGSEESEWRGRQRGEGGKEGREGYARARSGGGLRVGDEVL
jgi:hypothetical protein